MTLPSVLTLLDSWEGLGSLFVPLAVKGDTGQVYEGQLLTTGSLSG